MPEVDLSTASILLVDDNAQNLELMQAFLDELPCKLRTASDGVEAIESIDREQPDLVILDVQMPVMDGYTACEQILEEQNGLEEIPIIFFTNDNARHLTGFSSQLGTYLQKPVPDEALLATIDVLLEGNCCSTSEASF